MRLHRDRLVSMGQAYMSAGELPTAQKALLEAVRQAPGDPLPMQLLAEVLLRRGDSARAARVLRRLEAIDSTGRQSTPCGTPAGEVSREAAGVEVATCVGASTEPSAGIRQDVGLSTVDLIAVQEKRESSVGRFDLRPWVMGAGAVLLVGAMVLWWSKRGALEQKVETEFVAAAAPVTVPAAPQKEEAFVLAPTVLAPTLPLETAFVFAPMPPSSLGASREQTSSSTSHSSSITHASSGRELYLAGRAKLKAGDRFAASKLLRQAVGKHHVPIVAYFYLGEALSARNSPAARDAYMKYLTHVPTGALSVRARRAIGR